MCMCESVEFIYAYCFEKQSMLSLQVSGEANFKAPKDFILNDIDVMLIHLENDFFKLLNKAQGSHVANI